jgi:pentatricopeptide repeat domain-containing protein 1
MAACAKAKPVRAEKALELLAAMRADGVAADVVVYTAAIDACAKAKGSLRVFSPRQAAATARALGSSSGSSSRGDDENKFGASVARTGPERALELLDEMRHEGLQPNGFTYGCAINACAAEGRWERALELLEAARNGDTRGRGGYGGGQGGRRGGGGGGGGAVGLPAYNAALRACERGRQPQRALDLLHRMETEAALSVGPAPDVRSYAAAIAACAKAQAGTFATLAAPPAREAVLPEGAGSGRALLRNLASSGSVTSSSSSSSSSARVSVAWWEAALQLLNTAKRSGPAARPNCFAYAAACAACARDGEWQAALQLLDEMALLG